MRRSTRGDLAELTGQLVAIDSTNPALVPTGAGEEEIAGCVAAWLGEAGLEVDLHEAAPGRRNVVAVARGTGGGRSLILKHLGHDVIGGVAFWADSALLAESGIPSVVFGPVVGGIHGVDEWVDLASLQRCHDAYLAVARELCT